MNEHVWVTSEHARKIDCVAMIGVINQVDLTQIPPAATVDVDDLTTDWLPMCFGRAGANTDWAPYEQGEQVLVISPYGDPSQGVIVCALNQANYPPPSQSADLWAKAFKDGAVISYDRSQQTLSASLPSGGALKISASGGASIDGSIISGGNVKAGPGCSGSFTTPCGQVVVYQDGLITNVY